MHHPFEKLFIKALRTSTRDDNRILRVAVDLRQRGYDPKEIHKALRRFHASLIEDNDTVITQEALEMLESEEE